VHPVALFTILDHYLRRTDAQERVIGTLLGTRSDTGEIEVRSAFAVLHSETPEQVAVDTEYHHAMYDLHHKVNPKEIIVGWCVWCELCCCPWDSHRPGAGTLLDLT
jgi:translation initiation factor 3 subunit F